MMAMLMETMWEQLMVRRWVHLTELLMETSLVCLSAELTALQLAQMTVMSLVMLMVMSLVMLTEIVLETSSVRSKALQMVMQMAWMMETN
jgi:hypothetical protein